MKLKRLIAGTVVAGSLGGAALGLGAGLANAEPPPGPGPGWVRPGPPTFVRRIAAHMTKRCAITGRFSTTTNG
jgi:hypothetical protein